MRLHGLVLVVAGLAGVVGCANTGSVHERAPLTQSIATYKSAAIEVEVPGSMKNADAAKSQFANAIGEKLRERKLFAEIVPGNGDLTLKVKVTSVDEGSKMAQALGPANAGAAEVAVSVDLVDKQSKPIGAFDVTGNSKKTTQTSINGLNTAATEDSTARALAAAADEIASYLEKHRGG